MSRGIARTVWQLVKSIAALQTCELFIRMLWSKSWRKSQVRRVQSDQGLAMCLLLQKVFCNLHIMILSSVNKRE
jgi:hypothetical protein